MPVSRSVRASQPPAKKQLEDLKERLWECDEVVIRLQRGGAEFIRLSCAH